MVNSLFLPTSRDADEISPSTRTSTSLWTKYAPIDVTLTTAGTAQDLYAVTSDGEPGVNIATNPSFETTNPPAGFTAAGATLTRVTTVVRSGTYSISINPDNSAASEGFYWTTPSLASGVDKSNQLYLVASLYFHDNAGSSNNARIEIRDSAGTTTHATGNTVTLAAAWARSTCRFPLVQTAAEYRIYGVTVTQHNTTFFGDSLQVEIRQGSNATDYFDGANTMNTEWFGTSHASESRRRRGLAAIRGFSLHFSRDTYVAFDNTASSTTGAFFRAGSDWASDHPMHIIKNVSFINANAGETPRVTGIMHGVHIPNQAN
jgi:hypothetical protein